jgi:hypothetical protein
MVVHVVHPSLAQRRAVRSPTTVEGMTSAERRVATAMSLKSGGHNSIRNTLGLAAARGLGGGLHSDAGPLARSTDLIGVCINGNGATEGGVIGADLGGCQGVSTGTERRKRASWRLN